MSSWTRPAATWRTASCWGESAAALRWQRAVDEAMADPRRSGLAEGRSRDELLDAFRAANDATRAHLEQDREAGRRHATLVAAGSLLALVALLGLPAYVLFERSTRRAGRRGADHDRLADALQFARTQDDAYDVCAATSTRRSPVVAPSCSTATPAPTGSSRAPRSPPARLARALEGAAPDSCLAVRRGPLRAARAGRSS